MEAAESALALIADERRGTPEKANVPGGSLMAFARKADERGGTLFA